MKLAPQRKMTLRLTVLGVTALSVGGCAPHLAGAPAGDAAEYTVEAGGRQRSYLIVEPSAAAQAAADARFALVLVFHGAGGGSQQMLSLTGMDRVAEREGFFAVFPQGVRENWNDGRPDINNDVDDVGFVRALLDDAQRRFPIDPNRIYATGLSNGGHLCHRLAFDLPDRIAAIAPVAAALSTSLAARTPGPAATPILMIVGDADPIAPYRGGTIGVPPFASRGAMLSVADATLFWVTANDAAGDATVAYEPDRSPGDGTRVRREWFAPAASSGSAPVAVLTVEGGGHAWPGGAQYLPEALIGRTSRDIAASEEIWTFFEQIAAGD